MQIYRYLVYVQCVHTETQIVYSISIAKYISILFHYLEHFCKKFIKFAIYLRSLYINTSFLLFKILFLPFYSLLFFKSHIMFLIVSILCWRLCYQFSSQKLLSFILISLVHILYPFICPFTVKLCISDLWCYLKSVNVCLITFNSYQNGDILFFLVKKQKAHAFFYGYGNVNDFKVDILLF